MNGCILDYDGSADERHKLIDEDGEPMADGYPGLRDNVHPSAPDEEEVNDHVVAPGEPHYLPIGVTYQGEWRELADGLAKATREQSLALAMHLPVSLHHVHVGETLMEQLHPDVVREVGYMPELMFRSTAVAIRQVVFHGRDFLRGMIVPAVVRISDEETERRIRQSTIIYTSWERDAVHASLIDELHDIGELWVPCQANRDAFVRSGFPPERVLVMPHCYNPATHLATQISWPRGSEIVPTGRRFYHIGKWEPRKNQHGMIGAFLRAFTPKDRVSLLIKTHGWGYWDDYPNPEESLEQWAKDDRVIANGWTSQHIKRVLRIVVDRLSDDQIADLHRGNNIYVSASHGEAWDIPAFDALCAGNSLIHVGYGGTEEYADLATKFADVVRVDYWMGPVHPGYNWESDANWAEYAHDHLVDAFRRAKSPVRRVHPPQFRRFSRVNVGKLMCDAVMERVQDVGGSEVAEQLAAAGSFG